MAVFILSIAAKAQNPSDNPQWLQELQRQNPGLIDSTAIRDLLPSASGAR